MPKKSLKESAYEKISDYIIRENLKPGDMLPPEESLTKIADASRTPVRAALNMLEQEGVIETIPRRGTFITQISLKDVQELFQLREAIEGLAARLAARRVDQDQLSIIEKILNDAMKEEDPERKQKLFDEGDDMLHTFIFDQSGNQRLRQVSRTYSTILKIEINVSNTIPGVVEKFHDDHAEVITALRNQDSAAAERAMKKHISNVYRNILLTYEKNL